MFELLGSMFEKIARLLATLNEYKEESENIFQYYPSIQTQSQPRRGYTITYEDIKFKQELYQILNLCFEFVQCLSL